MKKQITFITIALLSFCAFAQKTNNDYLSTIGNYIDKSISRFENYSFEEYEPPKVLDLQPIEVRSSEMSKAAIVKDMNYMWYRLVGEEKTIVLIDGNIDDIDFDYSGETLYVLFSDEMFESPRWQNTIAYYACRTDERMFPTTPKYKNGVFPLIVVRNSTTKIDKYTYNEYMRDVLVHEMLHYALNRYEDFNIDHQHDDTFMKFALGWSKELSDLNIEIKPYASQFELDLLIK